MVDERAAVGPSREDASELGLRWGGRALAVNGIEVAAEDFEQLAPGLAVWELGASNTLRFERGGQLREVTIPVRLWTWEDALFTHGLIDVLALLFVATALTSFWLRPYETTSWAILALATTSGGLLTVTLIPNGELDLWHGAYMRCVLGLIPATILHSSLAFPIVHPLLHRRRFVLGLYGLGLLHAGLQLAAWSADWAGDYSYLGVVDTGLILATVLFFIARCGVLAIRTADPLVAQRARILLFAALVGGGPPALGSFLRNTVSSFGVDMRVAYWAMAFFFLPLGYVSVRQSLVNAGGAVRRAVAYAAVAGVLTVIGLALVAVQAYAIALLLFPLLYWWPQFDRRLTARIYPRRARFPDLLRQVGSDLASCTDVPALLEVLAGGPERLCESRSAVAFLFAGAAGATERAHTTGGFPIDSDPPLADETLVKLMEMTRREIFRDQVAVESQFSNVEAECYAGFDRLDAELLLPILSDGRVIGGLAVGPRATGDPYEGPELYALSTVAESAAQSLLRIEALQALRGRDSEFQELKRFLPPQIIDQIMEKGGASELRSARKLVTVFFADLRGFTSFSEGVEPEEIMATLAEYHAAMGQRIAHYGGTLERFAGDGFMVFFNDPVEQPDHVERAASMAVDMRADVQHLQEGWRLKGYEIGVGMGIHTGYATVGFIGYEGRRDYAVIGNVTNLAARLSDAASAHDILVTGSVRAELKNGLRTEAAGTLSLKGISRPQPVFRLLESLP